MFEPTDTPRAFGLPPGVDFPAELVAGLRARLQGQPPEAMARVEIYVNTRRMARRPHRRHRCHHQVRRGSGWHADRPRRPHPRARLIPLHFSLF